MTDIDSAVIARFRVEGRARSKGSLNVYCIRNRNHTVRVAESVEQSKPWRNRIVNTIRRDVSCLLFRDAVEVRATYFFEREMNSAGMHLKDTHAEEWPIALEFGDLDKLDRNLLDALTDSRLIADDRQVVRIVSEKRWAALGNGPCMQVLVLRADPSVWISHTEDAQ